jgi:hypothetical protein
MSIKKIIIIVVSLAIASSLIVVSSVLLGWPHIWGSRLVRSCASPNGLHKFEIWEHRIIVCLPGDGGQGDRFVVIRDKHGRILIKKDVLIQDDVVLSWSDDWVEEDRGRKWVFRE